MGLVGMKLTDLLAQYARKRLRGASENTLRLYRHTISSFGRSVGHDPTLDDLTDDVIEDHMWKIVERGCSPASANKDRSQLICLWRWAAEKRLIDRWPDVQSMKEPEIAPLGWMPDEIDSLLRAADRCTFMVGEIPGRIWFGALVRVCLDTGERIGAIRGLGRTALQGHYLHVPAQVRKGKTRDRLYPLNPDTVLAVNRLVMGHGEKDLFPFPYSHTYFYRLYDRILDAAGLPTDRRSKTHRIRRTVASVVARAGGDPTAALDHASPKTTKRYLDTRIVGGTQVCEILAAYLRDPTLRTKTPPPRRSTG